MTILIKIGGSLFKKSPTVLSKLCKIIYKLSKEYKIIVIPGGGGLADHIRILQRKFEFSDNKSHWMAIMAMDINGMLISEENKNFELVRTIPECKRSLNKKNIPIFLPYNFLKKINSLPENWEVTSDSIALVISHFLDTDYIILLKDVNGIYGSLTKKKIIKEVSLSKIKHLKSTCIDSYLPSLVKKYKREVYIVSGLYPERIKKILKGEKTLYTKVIS
ncbi:MAG: hypothetical protein P9M06_05595 [Candidatus Saelkia tenebricola]|nr:hypothetical protein [Candidatus Saelkia tenebricola]